MNDKLNMDKQMREKLESFSLAPPPHIFNNVQAQLAMQRKKRRLAYIGYISAAAVIVFAFIAGWHLNENKSVKKPAMVEQKMILTPEKNENKTENIIEENKLGNTKIASNTTIQEKPITPTTLKTKKNTETTVTEELNINNSFVASVERASFELMESIEAFLLDDHQVSLAQRKKQNQQVSVLNETDAILIAQNAKNYHKQEISEKGWIIGAHVSPGYSSQSTEYSEQYASNMDYSSDNSSGNVGGGLSVQYKTSKRLRIESGVYYSQNGHSAGNSSRQSELDYGGEFLFSDSKAITAAPSFSNTVQTNSGGISMNSSAGVINMSTTPKGASIATYTETIDARNTNTLNTNGEFSQEFEFVEIPLYLRYSVLDKKFGIEILGGINAGLVIGNNAYIDNDFGKQNVGSTDDISSINLSGTVGLGMNYALGKHFSLAMEPRFNYYLNSINTNPDVNYKPYRLGFYTGIYYEF